ESKSLVTVCVALNLRNVVRHHHAVEADLFIDAHRFQHVDVTVVDKCFLEIEETSTDVSEMHVEDFLPAAKVADHVEDFLSRLLQHLRDSTLAEIQPMVGILFDRYEPFETVYRTEYGFDTSEAPA